MNKNQKTIHLFAIFLLLLTIYLVTYEEKEEKLKKILIFPSYSSGLEVIHFEDNSIGIDSDIWAEFIINANCFDEIIHQNNFKEILSPKELFGYYPDWWDVEKLESPRFFEYIEKSDLVVKMIQYICVDQSLGRVFFVYITL